MAMELARLACDSRPSIYTRVAAILDIEADGGDDPGEVVRWAIRTALTEQEADDVEEQSLNLAQKAKDLRAL
jgi:hypothetical protein